MCSHLHNEIFVKAVEAEYTMAQVTRELKSPVTQPTKAAFQDDFSRCFGKDIFDAMNLGGT
jgi:hypothetical protein